MKAIIEIIWCIKFMPSHYENQSIVRWIYNVFNVRENSSNTADRIGDYRANGISNWEIKSATHFIPFLSISSIWLILLHPRERAIILMIKRYIFFLRVQIFNCTRWNRSPIPAIHYCIYLKKRLKVYILINHTIILFN